MQADVGWIEQELNEVRGNCRVLEAERDKACANRQQVEAQLSSLQAQLATLATDREELAQLKKEAKEAAAEVHREGRSIELEKAQWQQQLTDARGELADAQATILNQGNKIRELERGYSLKPNPAESALRLEIGNLREELEAYKQQQPAIELELLEPANLLNQLKLEFRLSRSKSALAVRLANSYQERQWSLAKSYQTQP